MKTPPTEILHPLLYILHRGLSDLRYIARDNKNEQAYELADTLENIPGFLTNWEPHYLDQIQAQLERYQTKYKDVSCQDYIKYLKDQSPPEHF